MSSVKEQTRAGKPDKVTILLVAAFLLGVAALLYPTVANWWNDKNQSYAVDGYAEAVEELDETDYPALRQAAQEYNAALAALAFPLSQYDRVEGYDEALSVDGSSVMGYVTIPCIGVELPIYHGTADEVLQVAIGHLEGTSLPVGGESTHCVLVGHRGLPSAELFTDVSELELGDTFTVTTLDETLTYEVDQIRVVEPDETDDLAIVEGEDYCTLLTCTPYGVNSHRLLVRGTRVPTVTEEETAEEEPVAEKRRFKPIRLAPVLAAVLLALLLVVLRWGGTKKRKNNRQS